MTAMSPSSKSPGGETAVTRTLNRPRALLTAIFCAFAALLPIVSVMAPKGTVVLLLLAAALAVPDPLVGAPAISDSRFTYFDCSRPPGRVVRHRFGLERRPNAISRARPSHRSDTCGRYGLVPYRGYLG